MIAARQIAFGRGKGGGILNPYQTEDEALVLCYDPEFKLGDWSGDFQEFGKVFIEIDLLPAYLSSEEGFTYEIVIDHTFGGSHVTTAFLDDSTTALGSDRKVSLRAQTQWIRWAATWSGIFYSDPSLALQSRIKCLMSAGYRANTSEFLYKNGASLPKSGSTEANSGGNVIVLNTSRKSFRAYNRVLSAEEIAHNYAIDKARFGL